MDKFRISDIREVFARDLAMFADGSESELRQLLGRSSSNPEESLTTCARNAHALKGLCATVEASALARWGGDLEQLFEVSRSYLRAAPEKADQIFRFVLKAVPDWRAMNEATVAEDFGRADSYYGELSRELRSHWGTFMVQDVQSGHFAAQDPAPISAPNVTGSVPKPAIPEVPLVRSGPPSVAPPKLMGMSSARISPGAPAIVPPVFSSPRNPPTPPVPAPPATVAPAHSSPPLRHAAPVSPAAAAPMMPPASPPPSPMNTAPIPSVASPSLRRKAPGPSGTHTGSLPVVSVRSPVLIRKGSFRSITPATAAGRPSRQVDGEESLAGIRQAAAPPELSVELRELGMQELSGYLAELSGHLSRMAVDLEDLKGWENARRLFHSIKGTAGILGRTDAVRPAKTAEARCLLAVEQRGSRDRGAFDLCLGRAQAVALALKLPFDRTAIASLLPTALETVSDSVEESGLDPVLVAAFSEDLRGQVESLEQSALRWERGEDPAEQSVACRRAFHTIKGAANSIGMRRLGRSVHEAESLLDDVAGGRFEPGPEFHSFLLRTVDQLRGHLRALSQSISSPWKHDWTDDVVRLRKSAEMGELAGPAELEVDTEPGFGDSQVLRIDSGRLLHLINLVGETVVDRARIEKRVLQMQELHRDMQERVRRLAQLVESFQQQFEFNAASGQARGAVSALPGEDLSATQAEFSDIEFDRYDNFGILARSLTEVSHDIREISEESSGTMERFSGDTQELQQTVRRLQENVVNLGLIPVSSLYPRLERAFRDALNAEGKAARLQLEGGQTLIDKAIVDRIHNPLMHLLRNAVAHGIEPSARREASGKTPEGHVRIETVPVANQVIIHVSDDGSGLNMEKIRQRAIEKGLLSSLVSEITVEMAARFIFQPGFSTSEKVGSVAGRGIGLDVVRTEIQSLNGSIQLTDSIGSGVAWTIRLPLNLSIADAVLIEAGGQTYALPMSSVAQGIVFEPSMIQDNGGRRMCQVGESLHRFADLRELFGAESPAEMGNAVLLVDGDNRVVLAVDQVLSREEIVVKQLDQLMSRHPLLNGVTIDTDGKVLPILNPGAVARLALGEVRRVPKSRLPNRPAQSSGRSHVVLIVDDSLSVRRVLEQQLTELRCTVLTAGDGLAALEQLRRNRVDIILTDLEMPQMNGYELLTELRGNAQWSSIPAVVISSRGADKYVNKALALGARTFLPKPFTSEQISEVVRHLVESAPAGPVSPAS